MDGQMQERTTLPRLKWSQCWAPIICDFVCVCMYLKTHSQPAPPQQRSPHGNWIYMTQHRIKFDRNKIHTVWLPYNELYLYKCLVQFWSNSFNFNISSENVRKVKFNQTTIPDFLYATLIAFRSYIVNSNTLLHLISSCNFSPI